MTKLERDASSGTALQEITFWINLENALNKIHRKRNSMEVNLTLDVLKAGKRFHATVSFDSDTGEPCEVTSRREGGEGGGSDDHFLWLQ